MRPAPAPPRLARWLFAAILHDVDHDAVLGDLEETYAYFEGRYGAARAGAWYWSQVLRSLPTFVLRTVYWSLVMLKSYWKLARRNLVQNATYTVINVLGLGMALAMCVVAYLNYAFDRDYDAFHTNADAIYRINSVRLVGGEEQAWGLSPLPLAEALAADVAGVERTARLRMANAVVRHEDRVFNETIAFADPAFREMFTFPLAAGDPAVMRHPDQITLTPEMAVKYFGDEAPLGRLLTVRFGDGREQVFTVGAVVARHPRNSSIQFDFMLPFDVLLAAGDLAGDDWRQWAQLTFVQVPDPAQVPGLERQLGRYVGVQNAARPDFTITRFYAEPLRALAPHARETRGHVLWPNVPPSAVVGSAVTALLVLLMACFNFINLSVVASARRLKEIGVRKVMGSVRRQLVGQFMGENLLLCLLALVVALGLAKALIPLWNGLWTFVELELTFRGNAPLFGFLGLLVAGTALVAGAYPAFYASAFNPIQILRGTQRLSGASLFSRVLLGFQFSLTILGVAGSLLFAQNARYQETLDLGYDRAHLLGVALDDPARFAPLRDAVARHPAVADVAGTHNHPGFSWSTRTIRHADAEHEVQRFDVGERYLETAGLRLVAGRGFEPEREADRTSAVLVNEALARTLGWSDPVGQFVTMDSVRYTVVGVVADFHAQGVWIPIEPAVLRLAPPEAYQYLVVQARPGRLQEARALLEQTWKAVAPDAPYDGFYQDEVLADGVQVSQSIRKMFAFVAVVTLLIAGTGLFALVSLNIARRTKEIGIRKVLGASTLHIGQLINRPFVALVAAATLAAAASGYYAFDLLLGAIYTYHVAVGPVPFAVAALLVLVLALLAVAGKVYRAASANPVHALRSE